VTAGAGMGIYRRIPKEEENPGTLGWRRRG